ncbi:sigma-70 family RNA polymerase sigma factor [Nonomuraea angiospora]|uniref:RNA polymerase sigma factor n=1 Tax=Nonomuraea angiospora TaxID=46172 RepID=UPI00340AF893
MWKWRDPTKTRRDAHERIYARYGKRVLAVCLAHLDPERAQDAAQESFLVLMDALARNGGPEPGKLGPWLYGVARNKVRETYRDRRVTVIELPEEADTVPEWIGAADDQASEARRRAEVLRLLDIVASGLTERQRRIYWLTVREELRGQALANALNVAPAEANRLNSEVRKLMTDGFGCFLLADYTQFQWRSGQTAETCQGLLKVIRAWSQEHGLWTPKTFPALLRQQVSQHVRDCAACSDGRRRVVRPYLPGLIPVLLLPALSERMSEKFARVSAEEELGYADPRLPAKTLPRHEKDVTALAASPAPGRRASRPRRSRRMLGNGLAAALTLALLAGGVYAWAGSGSPGPSPAANGTRPVGLAPTDDPASTDPTAVPSSGTETNPAPSRDTSAPKQGELKITPNKLSRGQQYTITLTGFRPWEKIFIRGDPYRLTADDVTADRRGGVVVRLTVGSDVDAKEYTVTATGRSSLVTARNTVVVVPSTPSPSNTTPVPSTTPSPSTPPAGGMKFTERNLVPDGKYPVTLTGFSPGEDVEIHGAPFPDTTPVRANADGSETVVYLAVGRLVAGGDYPVTATGKTSRTFAKDTVSVEPVLRTPAEVAFGESVTITGLGFPANTPITLTFTPYAEQRHSGTNCCSGNFTVNSPELTTPGVYTITATGGPGVPVQTKVTVLAPRGPR